MTATWSAVGDDARLAERRERSSRIPDLLFGLVLPLGDLNIAFVPVNELAAAAIILLASFRRPRFRLPLMVPVVLVALWLELVGSGLANDVVNIRRLGHLAIVVALVVVIGQGRVHLTSLARGIGLGLAIGIPVSLPSIVTGGYPGRLTGLFGDPNGAGMLMVTMTPLVMGVVRGRWRWLVGLLGAGGVLLTFSRTSLLALAFVVVWMLVASRLSLWLGAAILGPVAVLVAGQLESLRLAGPFAARQGSDLLRERIAEAAAQMLEVTPWYGNGPGTARVTVQNLTFFLHNSYDAVRLEGGWVALVLLLSVAAFALFRVATSRHEVRNAWFEAALGASLICALNLGEVLLELQFATIVGVLYLLSAAQRGELVPDEHQVQWAQYETAFQLRAGRVGDDDFVTRIQQSEGLLGRPEEPSRTLDHDIAPVLLDHETPSRLIESELPEGPPVSRLDTP